MGRERLRGETLQTNSEVHVLDILQLYEHVAPFYELVEEWYDQVTPFKVIGFHESRVVGPGRHASC